MEGSQPHTAWVVVRAVVLGVWHSGVAVTGVCCDAVATMHSVRHCDVALTTAVGQLVGPGVGGVLSLVVGDVIVMWSYGGGGVVFMCRPNGCQLSFRSQQVQRDGEQGETYHSTRVGCRITGGGIVSCTCTTMVIVACVS